MHVNVLRCKSLVLRHVCAWMREGEKRKKIQAKVKFHYYYNFHNVINKREYIRRTKHISTIVSAYTEPVNFPCNCMNGLLLPLMLLNQPWQWFINSCIEMLKNNIRSWIIVYVHFVWATSITLQQQQSELKCKTGWENYLWRHFSTLNCVCVHACMHVRAKSTKMKPNTLVQRSREKKQ